MTDQHDIPSDFLATKGLDSGIHDLAGNLIGTQVGVYQVVSLLGVGGMGEVYRARDTKLSRDVAIKVLPSSLAANRERIARFEREAKTLAALNHPNIAAIYGLEESDGTKALVMELVEGPTLAEGIARGRVPVDQAFAIAKQIVEALEAAHEQGIVHRDLKPANIKVRPDGTVKVLDFGLAKATQPAAGSVGETAVPPMTANTEAGIVIGTPAYMSPEQARGQQMDKRTDIWAFGCVLYELLTGRPPFTGDTISDTIAAILEREPDWTALPSTTAPGVVRLLKRCLNKDARRRLRDIGDARIELDELDRVSPVSSAPRPRVARRSLALIAGVAILVALIAVTYWALARRSNRPPATLASAPASLTTYPGHEMFPSLSTDGNQVAFAWAGERGDNWDIYIKVVGSAGAPLRLTTHPAVERFAVWSPDGRQIAFGRERAIFLISPFGGAERKLADFEVSSPMSWSPDGQWIAASRYGDGDQTGGVWLIAADDGEQRQITSRTSPFDDRSPSFSPDGSRLAFASCQGVVGRPMLGSPSCNIEVTAINDAFAPRTIGRRFNYFGGLAWTPDGEALLYAAGRGGLSSLWRVPTSGFTEPEQLTFLGAATQPAISFARRRLAYTQIVDDSDVWMFENGRGSRRHLSSTRGDGGAMFSPDGTRIVFSSSRSGTDEIWVANADGTHPLQLTSSKGRLAGTPKWSPDGQWIAYDVLTSSATRDISIVDAAGGRPRPVVVHPAQDRVPSWSRDGKFIYFTSNRNAGNDEIFRVPVAGGDPTQVTDQGGYVPFESSDAAVLYYTKRGFGTLPLFARPLSGGPERQVLDAVYQRAFVPALGGIYFIEGSGEDGRFPLKFFEHSSGKTRILTQIDGIPGPQLSISPDGQRALYSLREQTGADLMLVENFR